jgi:hypothetical protein
MIFFDIESNVIPLIEVTTNLKDFDDYNIEIYTMQYGIFI